MGLRAALISGCSESKVPGREPRKLPRTSLPDFNDLPPWLATLAASCDLSVLLLKLAATELLYYRRLGGVTAHIL